MNKVLLVTGGGRGIGAAVAVMGAAKGFAVAVNYRGSHDAARKVVETIADSGGEAIAVQADVGSREEVSKMFETVDENLGRVTALVNNAGVLEVQSRIEAVSPERLLRIFRTNVFGAIFCAQEAIKRMSTRRGGTGGSIVNVSSVAARLGAPREYVDYAASKGALDTFTVGLAKEVADEGIRVNGVRPGFIYTGIHASGGEPERVDRVKDALPLRRGGHPEEVASAILWLLSGESSYTTGGFIEIAGGV